MNKRLRYITYYPKVWMEKAWGIAKLLILALVLGFAFENAGLYGVFGVLSLIIGLALFRLYKSKEQYLGVLRYLESMIWGKPLDKIYWGEKEWQERPKRKLKFVWKKKERQTLKDTTKNGKKGKKS